MEYTITHYTIDPDKEGSALTKFENANCVPSEQYEMTVQYKNRIKLDRFGMYLLNSELFFASVNSCIGDLLIAEFKGYGMLVWVYTKRGWKPEKV